MSMISTPSVSEYLSLEEVIARLKTSPSVDGVAEFGSRAISRASEASDYDLLVLVKDVPTRVFQMVTTIGERLADIVLVETETADALLRTKAPPKARSFEMLFVQKMKTAQILYDASERLHKVKQLVTHPMWVEDKSINPQSDSEWYAIWFWQSFGLLQLERMAQSQNPMQLSAADMMLTACLPGTWRSYFDVRGIIWEGEKAAIRYWIEHDADYLQTIKQCLEIHNRAERLAAYRELVKQTLEPIGKVFSLGETAVILANSSNPSLDVQRTLHYWNSLLSS